MSNEFILVENSKPLSGSADLYGAKNAVLVIMASLLLTKGKSILKNVPSSSDVYQMIRLLETLGARIIFDEMTNILEVDTSTVTRYEVEPELMKKMRASILVMGPLLGLFGCARIATPGGCLIGARSIDLHLHGFRKLGVNVEEDGEYLNARKLSQRTTNRIILEYPSVGATENLLMFAATQKGTTTIVNAALEPEVLDLINVLKKMGVEISIHPTAIIEIKGTQVFMPIEHEVLVDRLEAGALLLAAAVTGGDITLPTAQAYDMDIFLEKLSEMGHFISIGHEGKGVSLKATDEPKAIEFKTGPYPGFPTDLQSMMMTVLCLAEGKSVVEETVFENRFMHVPQLQKMGAQISVHGSTAIILGVGKLYGTDVIATDLRASSALALAGLVAEDRTRIIGLNHWRRGYHKLEEKLMLLGGKISVVGEDLTSYQMDSNNKQQGLHLKN